MSSSINKMSTISIGTQIPISLVHASISVVPRGSTRNIHIIRDFLKNLTFEEDFGTFTSTFDSDDYEIWEACTTVSLKSTEYE